MRDDGLGAVAEINRRLDAIAHAAPLRVLFAAEIGSRAWGRPSPASDYDVRFVFVRPLDAYLRFTPEPDVIAPAIVEGVDLCGWDARKALKLALKGNPTLLEWLGSSIVYRADADAVVDLREIALKAAVALPPLRHHLHLGRKHQRAAAASRERVKPLLYAARSALALAWTRLAVATPAGGTDAGRRGPPSLAIEALARAVDWPEPAQAAIAALLRHRAGAATGGTDGAAPTPLAAHEAALSAQIEAAFADAAAALDGATAQAEAGATAGAVATPMASAALETDAAALFRRWVAAGDA